MNNIPSASLEAEQHLIACALVDDASVPALLEIPEDWFYFDSSKLIYRAIREQSDNKLGCDFFSIAELLKRTRQLDMVGGMEYLVMLGESLPSIGLFKSFKSSLFSNFKLRQIDKIKHSLEMQLGTGAKPEEMVAFLQESVFALMTEHHGGGFEKLERYIGPVLDEAQWREDNKGALFGQRTGLSGLDYTIDGFQNGLVYVLAGRPGSGKTAFALKLMDGLTSTGCPWFYFSLEMTGKSLAKRWMVRAAKVQNWKIRQGRLEQNDYANLGRVAGDMQDRSLYIDESPGLSIAQIRSRLKAAQIRYGRIGGITIDHIGLIKKDPRKSDTEAMNDIADELLKMAKEFDCPMLELSQLNRGVESRADKRPMMADLKQSGKIEENADVIMLLYRGDYYDRNESPVTEVNVAKNRDGESKEHYFTHDMALGDYTEYADYRPETVDKRKF